jgi:hypothetical protein
VAAYVWEEQRIVVRATLASGIVDEPLIVRR